jgi:dihydrofolate synthase / folylpolyglutamate synthase
MDGLSERLERLSQRRELAGMKYDLSRMQEAMALLGNPERNLRAVHITGTNGKGSTARMISSALKRTVKTGLYTSPHLVRVTERIQINDEEISAEEFVALYDEVERLGLPLTFFEQLTVMALLCFAREKVDWVVLEVGLGGRLDATNVVDAEVAVLTSIAVDHQQWLGDTPEAIAADKSHIIKTGASVFTTQKNKGLEHIIRARCEEVAADLKWTADYKGTVGLEGGWQKNNAGLAAAVLKHLGVSAIDIAEGIASAKWQGRMQRLPGGMLLDGAHNKASLKALGEELRSRGETVVLVAGTAHGKALEASSIPAEHVILTQAPLPQATPVGLLGAGEQIPDVKEALKRALALRKPGQTVLVTGSLYLVGHVLSLIKQEEQVVVPL